MRTNAWDHAQHHQTHGTTPNTTPNTIKYRQQQGPPLEGLRRAENGGWRAKKGGLRKAENFEGRGTQNTEPPSRAALKHTVAMVSQAHGCHGVTLCVTHQYDQILSPACYLCCTTLHRDGTPVLAYRPPDCGLQQPNDGLHDVRQCNKDNDGHPRDLCGN